MPNVCVAPSSKRTESKLHGSGSFVEVDKIVRLADMGVIGRICGFVLNNLSSFLRFTKRCRRLKNNLYNPFEENNWSKDPEQNFNLETSRLCGVF